MMNLDDLDNRHFDKNGNPITMRVWAEHLDNPEYKRVAYTEIGDPVKYRISTIWLGLNHRFGPGKPLIFETMVFGPDDYDYKDRDMERYCTLAQAEIGHDLMVQKYESEGDE